MSSLIDIQVLAEGGETMEHAQILAELGCDSLQGDALARPMPAEKVTAELLRANAHASTGVVAIS